MVAQKGCASAAPLRPLELNKTGVGSARTAFPSGRNTGAANRSASKEPGAPDNQDAGKHRQEKVPTPSRHQHGHNSGEWLGETPSPEGRRQEGTQHTPREATQPVCDTPRGR